MNRNTCDRELGQHFGTHASNSKEARDLFVEARANLEGLLKMIDEAKARMKVENTATKSTQSNR